MEDSNNFEFHGGFDQPGYNVGSQKLFHMLKCSMRKLALNGADKVFKDHRTQNTSISLLERETRRSSLDSTQGSEKYAVDDRGDEARSSSRKQDEKVCCKSSIPLLHPHGSKDFANVPQVVNSPPMSFINPFPLNILAFILVLLIKTIGFQLSLMVRFFTFPIWFSYFFFMIFLCPFQILSHIRMYIMSFLSRMWSATFTNVTSAVIGGLKTQKLLAVNVGFALFRSIYAGFMLLGILASSFVLSGLMMRHLVEKPIKTTEILNFDYTKPSPVALMPLMSSSVGVIPYNHKLQMTVSLTVPESEYNHRLGVFQVRVEFSSANGKVTDSSSYPCMLRFKSRPIQYIQTLLRSAPLIAGLQSETQVLNVKIDEHIEGLEPTASLKVILEQRAELHHGEGIPQLYAGTLHLESELPGLKRLVWYWRRTIFVWTSVGSFLAELVFILVFFRTMLIPRGRPEMGGRVQSSNFIFRRKTR